MEFKNNNKENEDNTTDGPTIDDVLPVIAELEHRVAALERALRDHEHNQSGHAVIRL